MYFSYMVWFEWLELYLQHKAEEAHLSFLGFSRNMTAEQQWKETYTQMDFFFFLVKQQYHDDCVIAVRIFYCIFHNKKQ